MIWSSHRKFEVLDIRNQAGSPEHFFHFFFGILVPLITHMATSHGRTFYFVRSCGPMNRILHELNLDNLAIVDKASMPRLERYFRKTTLSGFDNPAHYDLDVFLRARRLLLDRFGMTNSTSNNISAPSGIVMVDRGNSDPYYNSSLAEIKTSGKQRRSIPNFRELTDAIRRLNSATKAVRLEMMPLERQARLFSNAKISVMQHGAAIANVFWMKSGSTLIEINPLPDWANFSTLCQTFGVQHEIVPQEAIHGPVNIEAVVAAVQRAIQRGEST